MSTEMLLLAVLASMTVVAFMVAINSRGRWRATLSSLLAVCLLGGTVWVFTLQYSVTLNVDSQRERHRAAQEEMQRSKEQTDYPAAVCSLLVTQANNFADALLKEKLHDPAYSHDQLVARASSTEQRFEALLGEISNKRQDLDSYPAVAELLGRAMTELKAACHLYRAYYFAENSDAEASTERLLRQKARSARDTLAKAEKAIGAKTN